MQDGQCPFCKVGVAHLIKERFESGRWNGYYYGQCGHCYATTCRFEAGSFTDENSEEFPESYFANIVKNEFNEINREIQDLRDLVGKLQQFKFNAERERRYTKFCLKKAKEYRDKLEEILND